MELATIEISPVKFDQALRGGLDDRRVLRECADLAIYFKPGATESGKAGAVITFTVLLPDGTFARAQAVTTAAMLESVGIAVRGWIDGGHL